MVKIVIPLDIGALPASQSIVIDKFKTSETAGRRSANESRSAHESQLQESCNLPEVARRNAMHSCLQQNSITVASDMVIVNPQETGKLVMSNVV